MTKKRITKFIDRWRKQPTSTAPVETTTETETEGVREEKQPRRNFTLVVIVAIVAITLLTLVALAFMPGVRETRVARAIRFWEPAPPPAPAVPPGQLATEVEQAQARN